MNGLSTTEDHVNCPSCDSFQKSSVGVNGRKLIVIFRDMFNNTGIEPGSPVLQADSLRSKPKCHLKRQKQERRCTTLLPLLVWSVQGVILWLKEATLAHKLAFELFIQAKWVYWDTLLINLSRCMSTSLWGNKWAKRLQKNVALWEKY